MATVDISPFIPYKRLLEPLTMSGLQALKKISFKQKLHALRTKHIREKKQKNRPSAERNSGLTQQAKEKFTTVRSRLPDINLDFEKRESFACFLPPKDFSFSRNYRETLTFMMDFRRLFAERRAHLFPDGIRRKVYAEFADIERIGPGAGLVLAAEIHRHAQDRGGRVRVHDQHWSEEVRSFFMDQGLFELLEIDPNSISSKPSSSALRQTLKYASGKTSSGRDARELLNRLQALAGQSIGTRSTVYGAIAEALANVSHAYPAWFCSWPYRASRRWWASGFWEPTSKTVGLQLYDQGAGIPATLPRQTQYPRLLKMFDPERNDAGLIAAAMEYGRTSTGRAGRGKGLAEMADWIEISGSGFLRILSGSGEVTYRPGRRLERRKFDAPFSGTLVQWELTLG